MSKIEKLKTQYPHLNVTLMDLLSRIDNSKTKKYLPLLCKIFGSKFTFEGRYSKNEIEEEVLEMRDRFRRRNLNIDDLSNNEMITFHYFFDFFNSSDFELVTEFINNCENKRLDNLDVLTYSTLDEVMRANSLCSLKLEEKSMEGQVIKEFEDENWVVVRPLTFSSSAKYGAGTKWCTTMTEEKSYFHRYWSKGVLIYFINKKTGYKFGTFKSIVDDDDISFWNAEDKRVDFFTLEIDDYLYPIVRKILKSEKTNRQLCSEELRNKVEEECVERLNKIRFSDEEPDVLSITIPVVDDTYTMTTTYDGNLNEDYTVSYENPTMRA